MLELENIKAAFDKFVEGTKERFEQLDDGFIYDNKLKGYVASPSVSMKYHMKTLTGLLNQQDKQIKELKQSQKQLAIEELEKALVLIQNAVNLKSPEYDLVGLYDAIVDQIKSLKGEKDE